MSMPKRITVLIAITLFLTGCATLQSRRPPPPTLEEIVALAKEKVPAEDIIQRLEESRAVYTLSGSQLAKLREQGVPDAVLDYMHRAQIEQARYDEWLRARDRYFFYGPYYGRGFYGPWAYPFGPRYPLWW